MSFVVYLSEIQPGRILQDKNKGMTFSYNALGLPRSAEFSGAGGSYSIFYLYDAAGNKLQKQVERYCPTGTLCPDNDTTITDYVGNFIYENGELVMVYHPEGVIRPTPEAATNTTEYVYDPLAGVLLPTVTITAAATVTAATIVAASVAVAATATAVALTVSSAASTAAAAAPAAVTPPDGYTWNPNNPNQLEWNSFEGRSEGLDYITNSQTGEVVTRPMHTEFAKLNPTGDLPGRFASLNTNIEPRIVHVMSRMDPLAAGQIQTTSTAAQMKTGLTAFEASNAAKMQLLNYAGGAKAVPSWYMTGMTRVGQVGAGANMILSGIQYSNNEISGAKFTYDVGWSALGASPNPYAQAWYWSGVAGQYWGPSTWGWDIFGPDSYYGQFKYWIHKP